MACLFCDQEKDQEFIVSRTSGFDDTLLDKYAERQDEWECRVQCILSFVSELYFFSCSLLHMMYKLPYVPSRFLTSVSFFWVLIDTSRILNPKVSFMFQFFPGSRIFRASSMRLHVKCKIMTYFCDVIHLFTLVFIKSVTQHGDNAASFRSKSGLGLVTVGPDI